MFLIVQPDLCISESILPTYSVEQNDGRFGWFLFNSIYKTFDDRSNRIELISITLDDCTAQLTTIPYVHSDLISSTSSFTHKFNGKCSNWNYSVSENLQ